MGNLSNLAVGPNLWGFQVKNGIISKIPINKVFGPKVGIMWARKRPKEGPESHGPLIQSGWAPKIT